MQQVEHETFLLNVENCDSITSCQEQIEQRSETGNFVGIQVPKREHWQDRGAKCTLFLVHKKTLCISS